MVIKTMVPNMKRLTLTSIVASIGLLLMINAVYAPWSTLGTGYAITSDHHGIDVLPGTPVMVTAGSLDSNVVQVTFRWHRPDESVAMEVTKPVYTNGTYGQWNNGSMALIRYANDTYTPDVLGDWGVQAFFQDSTGTGKAGLENVIKIRATSFNTIPEVPLGTVAILLTMFGALAVFGIRKKISAPKR